jgi:hypothetical protein
MGLVAAANMSILAARYQARQVVVTMVKPVANLKSTTGSGTRSPANPQPHRITVRPEVNA